jgi:type VI secretion system protein ImpF
MRDVRADQPLIPSVLDRLLDMEPTVSREAYRSRNQILREMKQSVRRDLENLLNTRVRCVPWPPRLKEVKQSLVNYGIPDLSAASLGTEKEREQFCQVIKLIVSQFDRRLRRLNIRLTDQSESLDRTFRFQIDAILQVEPAPEPITFDSSLTLATGAFEVKGQSDER